MYILGIKLKRKGFYMGIFIKRGYWYGEVRKKTNQLFSRGLV